VRVADVVRSVTARLSRRAEAGLVTLLVQCGGGELLGDAGALTEALHDLLDGAVRAAPPGAVVFYATCPLEDGEQYWLLQATQDVPSLFHVDEGLRAARGVVARHGGMLRVESSPGLMSVSIWLPAMGLGPT
jgi:signal transduction histidine kinase